LLPARIMSSPLKLVYQRRVACRLAAEDVS
jgi:hypothetical protein